MDKYINNFGSFQKNVGRATTSINLVIAYIIGSFFILIGIICIVMGLIPRDSSSNFYCKDDLIDKCPVFGEKCVNNRCTGSIKRNYYISIIGLVLIIIAAIIIVLSKLSAKLANENRAYAQFAGAVAEVDLLKNIFRN